MYCDAAVADRAIFDNHLQKKHPYKKVDFSFDCKALTLLNEFLSENTVQVHVNVDGFDQIIKGREEDFTHYNKEKISSLMPNQDTVGQSEAGLSPTPKKKTRAASSLQNSNLRFELILPASQPIIHKTVGSILNTMAQETPGMKKCRVLKKCVVKDLLQELRKGKGVATASESKEGSSGITNEKQCDDTENGTCKDPVKETTSQSESTETPMADVQEKVEKGEKDIEKKEEEMDIEETKGKDQKNKEEEVEKGERKEKVEEKIQIDAKKGNEQKENIVKEEKDERMKIGENEEDQKEGEEQIEKEENVAKEKEENGEKVKEDHSEGKKTTPSRPVGRPQKKRRGRPKKHPIVEKTKEKEDKEDTASSPGTPGTTSASPGRYNLRLRTASKSFTEEADKVDTDEEDIIKKPKLAPKAEDKPGLKLVRTTMASVMSNPVLIKPTPAPTQHQQSKSFVMLNGKLVSVSPPPQPYVMGPIAPQSIQMALNSVSTARQPTPSSASVIQLQAQQQPFRLNMIQPQQQAPMLLNLGFPQAQQQQIFPMMNQQVQQPFILQPGLPNQPFQLVQQNNPHVLPNIPQAIPLYLRPQTPGVFSLGGQLIGSNALQNVLQQQPSPVLMTTAGVGTSAATASAPSVSASSSSTKSAPFSGKPIVIQPIQETSVVDSSCNSDTEETTPKLEPEQEPEGSIESWYFECYVCRNCFRIHLSVVELEEHIVKEELHQDVPREEYTKLRALTEKHVLTQKIPVLKKGNMWDLPVFRCAKCDLVHVLETFIRQHGKTQHPESYPVKCVRQSLERPSDLREMCVKGWSPSLVTRCVPQPHWSLNYYKESKEQVLEGDPESSGTSYKKVNLAELEKLDEEANPDGKSRGISEVAQNTIAPSQIQAPTMVGNMPQFGQLLFQPGQIPNFVRPAQIIPGMPQVQIVRPGQPVVAGPRLREQAVLAAQGAPQVSFQSSTIGPTSIYPSTRNPKTPLHYGCEKCGFRDKSRDVVQEHVLKHHKAQVYTAVKCAGCLSIWKSLPEIQNHMEKEHGKMMTIPEVQRFVMELKSDRAAARSLVSAYYSIETDSSGGNSSGSATVTSEYMEPDSSCDVEMTPPPGIEEEECDSTAGGSNISGSISAPNILSCFSEEDVDGSESLLSYNRKSLIHAVSSMDHMPDPGTVEVGESENRTGEAFACRLCAYSCDTELRIKHHLMSHHISQDMYPFTCMNCSYQSPSTLRLAQHILYKHQKQMKKNPPKLARDMERDKEIWPKIMRDESKYERFQQELDCLFRNCVERC